MKHEVLTRLDQMLDANLGPPYPADDRLSEWAVRDSTSSVPIVDRWIPPAWMTTGRDGGFALSNNVLCYQRGYMSQADLRAIHALHSVDHANVLYDFVLLVHVGGVVYGFCLLEFRCPEPTISAPSYLFISELFVHANHRHKGVSHQLVHACYTMGALMMEGNHSDAWNMTMQSLYLCAKASPNQIRFYSSCGLIDSWKPVTPYESFTPFSGGQHWNLAHINNVVCQCIVPETVFKNKSFSVSRNASAAGKLFFFGFPSERLEEIRRNGLMLTSHQGMSVGESAVGTFDEIVFTDDEPASGGVFVINVNFLMQSDSPDVHNINLGISIPSWFAVDIREV